MKKVVTVIEGDGIGKEVMNSVVTILRAMNVPLDFEFKSAGLECFEKTGELLPKDTLDSIAKNKVAIKGPTTTPVGTGHKSINVSLRSHFDLYANVRPVRNIPSVKTRHENVNLVIIRENTEDLYIGEERLIDGGAEAIKRITYKGSKRIAEFAYNYAVNSKDHFNQVTTIHKANIMKLTDGLFLKTSKEVGEFFKEKVETNDLIIDNACMQLVQRPERFKVILTENLYGDILSDLCAGLVGGLGVAPGANIGESEAIFEAVHGSAPDIAGKGLANPTALIQSAVMMLNYLNLNKEATQLENALFKALASDQRTKDLGGLGNTKSFTDKIISLL